MTTETKEILVTPDLAKKYLQQSEGNRPINKARVEAYVRDLQSNNWFLGDTIKFDLNGTLIDGHHRLNAILWAGIPANCLVTTSLPVESRNGINLAVPWKLHQISAITGEQFSRAHFTLAKVMEFGPSALRGGVNGARLYLTYNERRDLVLKYEHALSFVAKRGGHTRFLTTPILSVVARAYYSQSHERLETFMDIMKSGEVISIGDDSAAIRLRNYIISGADLGHGIDPIEVYRRTETALWHFCKRHKIKMLKPASEEMFPLKVINGKVVPA